MDKGAVLKVLKNNVATALGCTEPVALAYAGALAKERTSGEVKSIKLLVDKNFYKNCLRVTIPKTNLKGLEYAVALGITGGKPQYQLEVLKDISEDDINKAIEIVNSSLVAIKVRKQFGLYIEVCIETASDTARCLITGNHTNVVLLEHNGSKVINVDNLNNDQENSINSLGLDTIFKFIHEVDISELEFLENSSEMNMQIARKGLTNPQENFFGAALQNKYNDKKVDVQLSNLKLLNQIKVLTAAACDARMNGLNYPVAAIAGSGNQGIMAIVPVVTLGEMISAPREKVIKAIALSALITIYVKSKMGVLTPVCGCAIAAGAGAAAAMAYLLGGSAAEIEAAVINVSGGLAGMVCDGAKGGCAFKLAVAAAAAYDAAVLALEGVVILALDGIVGFSAEETISNVSYFVNEGMKCSDEALVYIMEQQLTKASL